MIDEEMLKEAIKKMNAINKEKRVLNIEMTMKTFKLLDNRLPNGNSILPASLVGIPISIRESLGIVPGLIRINYNNGELEYIMLKEGECKYV